MRPWAELILEYLASIEALTLVAMVSRRKTAGREVRRSGKGASTVYKGQNTHAY